MPAKKATSTRKTSTKSAARKPAKRAATSPAGERLIDHEAIRQWAEERGATPSCVRETGGKGDVGMIRLDFPGYTGEDSLQPIDWSDWFEKFDENDLALIVQETTAQGEKSNFNKLVKRTAAEKRPRTSAAH